MRLCAIAYFGNIAAR